MNMSAHEDTRLRPSAVLDRFIAAEVAYFAGEIDDFPAEQFLTPDFVLHEPESMPYGGAWHGPDGFRRFLEVMNATWSEMGPTDTPELVEHGDTVVVLATLRARPRATGKTVHPPVSQIVRVRDGRLSEARMFYWDTAALNSVFNSA